MKDHPVPVDRFAQKKIWDNKTNNQRDYKKECTYYTFFFVAILNVATIADYTTEYGISLSYRPYDMVHMIWAL